jgi:agmatinase
MGVHHPPYNFGGLPDEFTDYDKARVVVLPVPFGLSTSWQSGTERGPRAIIEASGYLELYDIETGYEVHEGGIHTDDPVEADSPEALNEKLLARVAQHLEAGKFVVTLGGEHTVAYGAAAAHIARYDDVSILHFDAHSDRRDEFEGSRFSHACTLRRISELNDDIISVGIRSLDKSELEHLDQAKTFFAEDIFRSMDWAERMLDQLAPNVYLTFDLDVLDPAIMPSTGTPEPGGLYWYQVLGALKTVFARRNVVGFDVVELMPTENKAPDFLAAKLVYKLLSYKFAP